MRIETKQSVKMVGIVLQPQQPSDEEEILRMKPSTSIT
jgi:hypothetical protein